MKRLLSVLLLLFAAAPLLAIETEECRDARTLAALYQVRGAMLSGRSTYSLVDDMVERLREPLSGGAYRWVRWVRPSGEPSEEKKLHRVKAPKSSPDSFEASGEHAYAVRVVVPSKRTLFAGNNAVWVGNVEISYTIDGRTKSMSQSINADMQPDTARTFDLPGIADHVDVRIASATSAPGESLVEVHFRQAVAEDDPANPAYETIVALRRVREHDDEHYVDDEIARYERAMYPSATPIPLLAIVKDLRRADDLIRSKKEDEQEKGQKLLRETLRRLR
jgi:hypothetical protein